ncbi:Tankyrase-2 [Phytophthora citrophthora]|uniref:Tankyrase-2 n=1 Tax=Phytophthora citrophthora TaxID=4793 RepID=A0AAD9FXY1_9STRA|nr:Tankyrase-2 [Phytophthora citrophthora]
MWAAGEGKLDVVRYLIEQGADNDHRDSSGRTPLMWAAALGASDVVQYLVRIGSDPTAIDHYGNSTLLHLMLAEGISEDELLLVAESLLKRGTLPLLSNSEGESVKSVAMASGFNHVAGLVEEYTAKSHLHSRGELSASPVCKPML